MENPPFWCHLPGKIGDFPWLCDDFSFARGHAVALWLQVTFKYSFLFRLIFTSWMTFSCISWCKYSWACSPLQQQVKRGLGHIDTSTITTTTKATTTTTTTTATTTPAFILLWKSIQHGVNLEAICPSTSHLHSKVILRTSAGGSFPYAGSGWGTWCGVANPQSLDASQMKRLEQHLEIPLVGTYFLLGKIFKNGDFFFECLVACAHSPRTDRGTTPSLPKKETDLPTSQRFR